MIEFHYWPTRLLHPVFAMPAHADDVSKIRPCRNLNRSKEQQQQQREQPNSDSDPQMLSCDASQNHSSTRTPFGRLIGILPGR